MTRAILCILVAAAAFAADDGWTKVRDVKSGTEVRIIKKGSREPVLAKMDEANDERVVVVLKNEQVSIAKDQIDRFDARPNKPGSRITRESKTTVSNNENQPSTPGLRTAPGPSTSVSSGLSIGSKPDFETIYRRQVGAPPKQ
jgi:hypothetical protein